MLFILSLNFTDQGIRNIKDGPKRAKAAREMAKKIGVDTRALIFGNFFAHLDRPIGEQAETREGTADTERSSGH